MGKPPENMEIDRRLFLMAEEGHIDFCFRLYEWDSLCVSAGFFQRVDNLNLPVELVRRPTGGGLLLHGWDISFAVAGKKFLYDFKDIYRAVASRIVYVFKELNIEASISVHKGRYSSLCYDYPTFGEIVVEGKKAVFMAMRTGRRAFIVHGSVYKDFDFKKASRILNVEEDLLRRRIISLKELETDPERFKELLRRAFEPFYGGGGGI